MGKIPSSTKYHLQIVIFTGIKLKLFYHLFETVCLKAGMVPKGAVAPPFPSEGVSTPIGENFYACRGILKGKLCSYVKKDTLYSVI